MPTIPCSQNEMPLEKQAACSEQSPPDQEVVTFQRKKRELESFEKQQRQQQQLAESQQRSPRLRQSVMARQRARCSAGRHHDRLATVVGLVIGFIGCLLLAAIVSSPCVQAEDIRLGASPSDLLSAHYYRAVVPGEVENQSEENSDAEESEEFVLGQVQEDLEYSEVPRSKSVGGSGGGLSGGNRNNKFDADEQLAAAASLKTVRTTPHLISGSENVILPKFGDRISPRKLKKKNTPVTATQQSDYYAPETVAAVEQQPPVTTTTRRPTISTTTTITASTSDSEVASVSSNSPKSYPRTDSQQNVTPSVQQEEHRFLNEVDVLPVLLNQDQVNNQNVSSAQAHRLEMSTEFFVVPPHSTTPLPFKTKSTTRRPNGSMLILAKDNKRAVRGSVASAVVTPPTIVAASGPMSGLRKEPWVVPVLVLATLSMFMMAAFEVFVLCKAWRTSPSRRHLFLGQMLLLGLFSCAGLAAILTATPTLLSCATVRFGAGVAFALVFASLLVKCVFLISLNGGVYLPAPYQGLLLLFAVLIQIAVGSQWLLTSPPAVDTISAASHSVVVNRNASLLLPPTSLVNGGHNSTRPLDVSSFGGPTIALCRTQFSELLLSLIYVVFLILFVAVLAIKSRGIRDNYREATYIGLAIGGSIPIWLGWTLCGLAVAERHRDACLAFGLIATSTTVFLVMFMPKGRQLAAMGKEGLYVEDREERFSSLSRTGSGYSPSFFHFKPIKYGVMGNANSPSNTNPSGMCSKGGHNQTLGTGGGGLNNHSSSGNGNNNSSSISKHQAVATLGGGE